MISVHVAPPSLIDLCVSMRSKTDFPFQRPRSFSGSERLSQADQPPYAYYMFRSGIRFMYLATCMEGEGEGGGR